MAELGRLERVPLRDTWEKEDQDFTPWLATEENLSVLADTLDMELKLAVQETNVGPFRADILCKNADGGSWVLIENQLERTDHSHLGQLLTYAAGSHAVTICWIAENFTEEHRAALDWLNEIIDGRFKGLPCDEIACDGADYFEWMEKEVDQRERNAGFLGFDGVFCETSGLARFLKMPLFVREVKLSR